MSMILTIFSYKSETGTKCILFKSRNRKLTLDISYSEHPDKLVGPKISHSVYSKFIAGKFNNLNNTEAKFVCLSFFSLFPGPKLRGPV